MKALHALARTPVLLALPAVALLVAIFGAPLLQLFGMSLGFPNVAITNYQAFFAEQANTRVLLQTVQISIVATTICAIIGYPTAFIIATVPARWRVALIVIVFIPWLTSALVRTYAWVIILGDRGLINTLLFNLGLISKPLELLYTRLALYIGMIHILLPAMILPMLSVMMGIDKSLMAAARSMGARPFAAFWRVYFPLTLPGLRSGVLLVFVTCLGFYITPAALGGLKDVMMSNFIAAEMTNNIEVAPVAATAFVLLAVGAIAVAILGLDLSRAAQYQERRGIRGALQRAIGRATRPISEFFGVVRAGRWTSQLYRPGGNGKMSWGVATVFAILVLAFLQLPGLIVVVMSFNDGELLQFPPAAVSLRWYYAFFGDASWRNAFLISLEIGAIVAVVAGVLGTLAAFGLNRTFPRLRASLTMLLLTPITFPLIVVAVVVYLGLLKFGLLGSKLGIVVAHSVGAVCYVVVIVSATLSNFDRRLERAAMSMRANPVQTFWRVTVPLIKPGIIGGAVFAFIHSFDEVVVTSLVSKFNTNTLPLKMLENISNQIDPTIAAVGSILTMIPVLWMLVLYPIWRKSRSVIKAE